MFKFFHPMQLFDFFVFKLRESPPSMEFNEEERQCVQNFVNLCASTIGGCGCSRDKRVVMVMEAYSTLCSSKSSFQRSILEKINLIETNKEFDWSLIPAISINKDEK